MGIFTLGLVVQKKMKSDTSPPKKMTYIIGNGKSVRIPPCNTYYVSDVFVNKETGMINWIITEREDEA